MTEPKNGFSRRNFLKTTGVAAGSLVFGTFVGYNIGVNLPDSMTTIDGPKGSTAGTGTKPPDENRGLMFFQNRHVFNVLSAATERIFPEDDLGPGAIGLGVPFFIDNQLAGIYGSNAREYMQGPFYEGGPTQGYQTILTRAEVFMTGLGALDREAQERFNEQFDKLEGDQMDEILTDVQKGDVEMKGVSSSFFFRLLRSATLEGAYSDPLYNGNINMEGWKMKGFPGHQMAYIDVIEEEAFQKIDPKPLSSMQH